MITITGSTGNIGSKLVINLLNHNRKVRVIARDARKLAALISQPLTHFPHGATSGVFALPRDAEGTRRWSSGWW